MTVLLCASCNAAFGIEQPEHASDVAGDSSSGNAAGNAATGGSSTGGASTGGTPESATRCGNGSLDAGEGCDDGNDKTGDGCAACHIEPGYGCNNTTLPSKCADINECSAGGGNDCDANADCTNTAGSFTCKCKTGYSGDGKTCTNIDECSKGTDNCSPNADCTDTQGSFTCKCKAGSSGNGLTCSGTSCVGLAKNCGASGNDACCAAPTVMGGTFTMGASTVGTIATFALDKYEVTVGRFRNFVNAYTGHPANGAGAHPLISGSGWQSPDWDASIDADKAALTAHVQCDATYQTWNAAGANDFLPMNCVTWFEAFAFCVWDGSRLPTDAEWEYAAKGGSENRIYPWGNTPAPDDTLATTTHANYNCMGDGSAPGMCAFADIVRVGKEPSGAGKWGHLDLAGSMWEWNLDWYATLPVACNNCANIATGSKRVNRGGAWNFRAAGLASAVRTTGDAGPHSNVGFRCARTP